MATLSLIPALGDSATTLVTEKTYFTSGKTFFKERFSGVKLSYHPSFCKPIRLEKNTISFSNEQEAERMKIQTLKTQNLVVQYKDKKIILPDCCFESGKKYLIRGDSGIGKSTFFKILMGEVNNVQGKILCNGETMEGRELQKRIAYVNQTVFLFNDTIYANIVMDQELTEAEVKKLMDVLYLDLDVHLVIEENGKNLSGGQRQKIAIARALAQQKSILLLDEATANIDENTAEKIDDLLLSLPYLVIVISHHITKQSLQKYDEILSF